MTIHRRSLIAAALAAPLLPLSEVAGFVETAFRPR